MIEGLSSPHPIGGLLPGLYQDDDFAQRFTAGLDEVLAPVLVTLDGIEAYSDPKLAPADFVEWLAAWVGLELDEAWPLERQRALVARAAQLHTWQGTRSGLSELVEIYAGVVPEIEESGATAWSGDPSAPVPGAPGSWVVVRLRVPDPAAVDVRRLERLVARSVPAEVVPSVEVLQA
jgi:phage tail-like protein